MNKEQKLALDIAVKRFGKERVLELHKNNQYTIDEWRCELRPLNAFTLQQMENELNKNY